MSFIFFLTGASFLLMLNHLLCHDEQSTLSGVMISSFTHKKCDLSSGTFFTPVNFLTIGASILVSFIGVSCFSANFAGTGPLKVYRPLRRGDEEGSQKNPCKFFPSNLPSWFVNRLVHSPPKIHAGRGGTFSSGSWLKPLLNLYFLYLDLFLYFD